MGYIKLDRAIRKWRWYTKKNMLNVWIELLLNAAFEDYYYDGQLIKRGQVLIGREKMANQLGIGVQELRTCLNRLVSTNEITIQSTNRGSIVTIINWDKYQSSPSNTNQQTNRETNQQVTSNQPTTNQLLTTIKEVKEVKETLGIEKNAGAYACFNHTEQNDLYGIPLLSLFEQEFGRPMSSRECNMISEWAETYDDALIRYALIEAILYETRNIDYIDRILFNWKKRGFTAEQYEKGER